MAKGKLRPYILIFFFRGIMEIMIRCKKMIEICGTRAFWGLQNMKRLRIGMLDVTFYLFVLYIYVKLNEWFSFSSIGLSFYRFTKYKSHNFKKAKGNFSDHPMQSIKGLSSLTSMDWGIVEFPAWSYTTFLLSFKLLFSYILLTLLLHCNLLCT